MVTVVDPKGNGGGAVLGTGAADAALPPKGNGFGGCVAEEPKVDCVAVGA